MSAYMVRKINTCKYKFTGIESIDVEDNIYK